MKAKMTLDRAIETIQRLEYAIENHMKENEYLRKEKYQAQDELYKLYNMTNKERFKRWLKRDTSDRHWKKTDYLGGILVTRKGDKYNTGGFTLDLGLIKLWSLDNCAFEAGIVCDTHWGIGATGILPYLRWIVCIPLPNRFKFWWDDVTRRKSKEMKEYEREQSILCNKRNKELGGEHGCVLGATPGCVQNGTTEGIIHK